MKLNTVMLFVLIALSSLAAQAQFNPTPFPLERTDKSACGIWVSLRGNYRLMITPLEGSCEGDMHQLQVTVFNAHQSLARGILLLGKNNRFCGSLRTRGPKNIDLCLWRQGKNLDSDVRRDSPWQPFEIFSKETYY